MSNEYANDVLGSKVYSPWLYVYSAINNKFKEGWIPDNFYGNIIVPKIKGDYGKIDDYKSLTSKLFKSTYFLDQAYFANGLWFSTDYQVLSDMDVLKMVNNFDKLIFKTDNSLQGKGIYIIQNYEDLQSVKMLGNGVLQFFIKQHPFFDNIVSNSVATIRITTVVNDKGEVSVRSCYLRVGRIEDTHVKSSSHIRIPINFYNGIFEKYGFTINWNQIKTHPDSNFTFENAKIPNFDKCLNVVTNLHKMIPFNRCIGWDLIIDSDNNVNVMEWFS